MKENKIEYEFFLSSDMKDKIRVSFQKRKGEILGFMVQYESLIEEKWHPIVRYDTVHEFAHMDVMHPDGTVDKLPLYFPTYNLAFVYAVQNLKKFWMEYRESYERRMKK